MKSYPIFWEKLIKNISMSFAEYAHSVLSINSFPAIGDLSSADNFCKQFGPRSGPTKRRA